MSEQKRVEETPTPRLWVYATWVDHVDVTVYKDIPIDVPPICVPLQTPPSPEWSSDSLPISPSSLVVPTLVASLVTTPAATTTLDEDEFLENTTIQRELQEMRDRVTIVEREGSSRV
nr:hypothetical protein [Tanacetum cinerariifolium]